jgi:hypothetical protein
VKRSRHGLWLIDCDSCGTTYQIACVEPALTRRTAQCNGWKVGFFPGQHDLCPDCINLRSHTPVNSGEETKKL